MTETPGDVVVVGVVGKPHGVKGEVLFHPGSDDASLFEQGRVFETDRGQLTVVGSRRHHAKFILLFEGLDDRTGAEALRGLDLRLTPLEVPLDDDEWWPSDLVGCRVILVDGTDVGEVVGVVPGGSQDRLIISTPATVEIPFVQALVPDVDIERRRVTIDPPEGLLDPPFSRQ